VAYYSARVTDFLNCAPSWHDKTTIIVLLGITVGWQGRRIVVESKTRLFCRLRGFLLIIERKQYLDAFL